NQGSNKERTRSQTKELGHRSLLVGTTRAPRRWQRRPQGLSIWQSRNFVVQLSDSPYVEVCANTHPCIPPFHGLFETSTLRQTAQHLIRVAIFQIQLAAGLHCPRAI